MPDRLLTILLERLADTGPTLAHNQASGTLTVLLSFASVAPFEEVSRLSKALGLALLDAGVETPPTVIDVHVPRSAKAMRTLRLFLVSFRWPDRLNQHNVIAERHGLMAELREEIQTRQPAARQTTLDEWLDGSSRGPTAQ